MSVAVQLTGAGKCYGRVRALHDVTLSVGAGEVLGLLGHNGAGKTTMMKLILGLIEPTGGAVQVLGRSPTGEQARDLRHELGYLPESVSFYEQLSGREVLDFFARLKNIEARECRRLLEQVGLAAAAGRRVKTYSKGMRQRLGLAQALLGKPRLLLLDEPTVGLDPLATRDFYDSLDQLRAGGTTVILSSHVLAGIEEHIDRAVILAKGQLLADGTIGELWERAGLPLTIRVRGRWQDDSWRAGVERCGAQVHRVNGAEFELSSPPAAKLEVMRAVLALEGVEDMEVAPPSLATLYARFNEADRHTGEEGACIPS